MSPAQFLFQDYKERRNSRPCCITYTPLGKSRVARLGGVYDQNSGLHGSLVTRAMGAVSQEDRHKLSMEVTHQNPFVCHAVNGSWANMSGGCHVLIAGSR